MKRLLVGEFMDTLRQLIGDLITRDRLRREDVGFLEAIDDDGVKCYHSSFLIKHEDIPRLNLDTLETWYVRPARLAVMRKIVEHSQSVELGEPYSTTEVSDGGIAVNLFFPVKEHIHQRMFYDS